MRKFLHQPVTKSDSMIAERLEAIYEELFKFNQAAEKEKATIAASVPDETVEEKLPEDKPTQRRKK